MRINWDKLRSFGHWLASPFRAARTLVPFTPEGRATLVYIIFAGAGPALTCIVWWAMAKAFAAGQWNLGGSLANKLAWGLLIIVSALGCYVSIRAIKLGPDGFAVDGREPSNGATTVTTTVEAKTEVKPPASTQE